MKDQFDQKILLYPNRQELTVTTASGESEKPKTNEDFEQGVAQSFAQGEKLLQGTGIGCVVFATKLRKAGNRSLLE